METTKKKEMRGVKGERWTTGAMMRNQFGSPSCFLIHGRSDNGRRGESLVATEYGAVYGNCLCDESVVYGAVERWISMFKLLEHRDQGKSEKPIQ